MKTPSLAPRAIRLFLALELAFSPLTVPLLQAQEAAPPFAERIARARAELSDRFAGALPGLPSERDALGKGEKTTPTASQTPAKAPDP